MWRLAILHAIRMNYFKNIRGMTRGAARLDLLSSLRPRGFILGLHPRGFIFGLPPRCEVVPSRRSQSQYPRQERPVCVCVCVCVLRARVISGWMDHACMYAMDASCIHTDGCIMHVCMHVCVHVSISMVCVFMHVWSVSAHMHVMLQGVCMHVVR